jgi:ADP-dependent phosphofructokinase/glucokinase
MASAHSLVEKIDTYLETIAEFPVFIAYNANVDALTHVDEELEALLDPPGESVTPPLETKQDLATAIASTMRQGEGNEMAMADEFGAWLEDNLEPDERRLGGQAGIMSDVVSILGASPIVYTYMLSETQRGLFKRPEQVRFPIVEDDELQLRPLSQVTNSDRTKVNWIFEFSKGQRFFDVTADTDTRFIAAARPERFNLETGDLSAKAAELGERVECAILSGHHSLKREYADGSDFEDHIRNGREFVRELTREHDITVQFEYGVTHNEELRGAIAEYIVPEVDVISLDDHELRKLASDFGIDVLEGEPQIIQAYELMDELIHVMDVNAIKYHATNYFLSVAHEEYLDSEAVREGFEFASVVAATKATFGQLRNPEALHEGCECPRSTAGEQSVERLADHMDETVRDSSIVTPRVVAHPNRVVSDPVSTVGLGDAVSSTSFVLENALYLAD